MSIKSKIEYELFRQKISITELTKKIGMSRDGYYKINDNSIKISTLKKIASVLNKPLSFFLEEKHPEQHVVNEAPARYGKEELTEIIRKQQEEINQLRNDLIQCKDKVIQLLEEQQKL